MRDFKCIAKDMFTRDWVSGYPLKDEDIKGRWYLMHNYSDGTIVDPETIRESTNYKDINSEEIFEGDLIMFSMQDQHRIEEQIDLIGEILKKHGSFFISSHLVKYELFGWTYDKYYRILSRSFYDPNNGHFKSKHLIQFNIRVIGNKFDNPELLSNEKN